MSERRSVFSSLRLKLVLVSIIVEFIMLGLLLTNSVRLLNATLEEQTQTRLEELTPLLSAALSARLFERDHTTIMEILEALLDSKHAGFKYIVVYDNKGKPYAQLGDVDVNNLPDVDKVVSDSLTDAVYDHAGQLTLEDKEIGQVRYGLSLLSLIKSRDSILKQGSAIAGTEIFLTFLLLSFAGYFLTRHLGLLISATKTISTGDYSHRIPVTTNDEIGLLADSFNKMTVNLKQTLDEKDNIAEELKSKAQDLEVQKIALMDARDQAHAANKAKSAFLANISHELRTPLNAILGYSEMLAEEAQLEGKQDCAEDLKRIHSAGGHLLSIISDILDLTKIEAGKTDLRLDNFSINEVIENVGYTIQPLLQKGGNELDIDVPNDVTMYSDFTRLKQILLNLLSNACKFTHNGSILINVEVVDIGQKWIYLKVSDTGVGINSEKIDHIFDAFNQADNSATREFGGTGLGLTITKRFVQLLGGTIKVESKAGEGSTFIVELPVEYSPTKQADEIVKIAS